MKAKQGEREGRREKERLITTWRPRKSDNCEHTTRTRIEKNTVCTCTHILEFEYSANLEGPSCYFESIASQYVCQKYRMIYRTDGILYIVPHTKKFCDLASLFILPYPTNPSIPSTFRIIPHPLQTWFPQQRSLLKGVRAKNCQRERRGPSNFPSRTK